MSDEVDEYIKQGYKSVSNRHRLIAKLPEGKTGLDALREKDPEFADRILRNANEMAGDQYMRVHGPHIELSLEHYQEFKVKTAGRPWPSE